MTRWLRSKGMPLLLCDILAHADHPGNELADTIADSVRPSKTKSPNRRCYFEHASDGGVEWRRFAFDRGGRRGPSLRRMCCDTL